MTRIACAVAQGRTRPPDGGARTKRSTTRPRPLPGMRGRALGSPLRGIPRIDCSRKAMCAGSAQRGRCRARTEGWRNPAAASAFVDRGAHDHRSFAVREDANWWRPALHLARERSVPTSIGAGRMPRWRSYETPREPRRPPSSRTIRRSCSRGFGDRCRAPAPLRPCFRRRRPPPD